MKRNEKFLREFGGISDDFIDEARPSMQTRRRPSWVRWSAAAVACLMVVSLGLWLFLPYDKTPPTADEYKTSPYYPVIAALVAYNYNPPKYDNNFDAVMDGIDDALGGLGGMAGAPGASGDGMTNGPAGEGSAPGASGGSDISSGAVDVTDNQVEGVEEADIIKRTKAHAFHLSKYYLGAFTIAGDESRQISRLNLKDAFSDAGQNFTDVSGREMFLSEDGKTVTVIATCLKKGERGSSVGVLSLDVTNPAEPRPLGVATVSGGYNNARRVGDSLILFSEFYAPAAPDYSKPESFIPTVSVRGEIAPVSAENVICPEVINNRRYTTLVMLSEKSLECKSAYAFLSYTDTLYVSEESIYLTRPYTDIKETPEEGVEGGINYTSRAMTEISRLSYSDGEIKYCGSHSVEGSVKNQYSMDEYKGMLRVVTTTQLTESRNYVVYNNVGGYTVYDNAITVDKSESSASLYVFDRESFELLGSSVGFAPIGETAESVRFDGETAYVCTAVVITLTDPVFFFDLSDVSNITYTDTGDIDGYSTSLVELGEGFLLGIGTDNGWNLKLEVYEQSDGNVVSVDSISFNGSYPEEYKSYYIDRENWLFGVPVNGYGIEDEKGEEITDKTDGGYIEGYILFRFDGYELTVVSTVSMGGTGLDERRGFVQDGYLYVLAAAGIWVREI